MTFVRCMALCLLCTWLGAGCSDEDRAGAERETVRYVTAEDVETEKWNSYVELANTVDPVVRSYLAAYWNNFPEPDYARPGGYFIYRIDPLLQPAPGMEALITSAADNTGRGAQSELDQAAREYSAALGRLWDAVWTANRYYLDTAWRQDSHRRGASLHDAVTAAYGTYDDERVKFFSLMDARDTELMHASIRDMRKDGREVLPAMLAVIARARAVDAELNRQGIEAHTVAELEQTAYTEQYGALVKALEQLEGAVANEELLRKEAVASAEADRVLASARQVELSARALLESARTGRRFDINSLVVGTPGHYSRELGLLTVRYNRLGGAPEPVEE